MNEHQRITDIIQGKNAGPLALHARRTALVVVDMQRYFTEPGFPFTRVFDTLSPGVTAGYLDRVRGGAIPAIAALLTAFRHHRAPIVYTAIGAETDTGEDLPCWLRGLDDLGRATIGSRVWPKTGDASWHIDPELAPRGDEPVLSKYSAGTFATTGLEQRLRGLGVDTVLVTGVTTDVCVSTTAREAADRNFRTIIVGDACAALSDAMHGASLEAFNLAFGWVRSANAVIDLLSAAPA